MQTEAGAVAFVTFYFEQVNKAWMTPDATLLPPLASAECQGCAALTEDARKLQLAGKRYAETPIHLNRVTPVPGARASQQYVSFLLEQPRVDIVDTNGQVVGRQEAGTKNFEILLKWEEGRWLALGIG